MSVKHRPKHAPKPRPAPSPAAPKESPLAEAIRLLAYAVAFVPLVIFSQFLAPFHFGKLERMGGLWTFWHYILFLVVAAGVLRTRLHRSARP